MKKKIIIIATIIICIFTAIGVTLIVNNISNTPGNIAAKPEELTVKKDTPTSGNPMDYSLADNVAFLAGKIDKKKNFTTETNGKVVANVAFIPYTQTVYNRRVVGENQYLQEAVSESTFKSVAVQNYFLNGKVLMRSPDKISGKDTSWVSTSPTPVTDEKYMEMYGFLPTEMSAYILNSTTILSTSTMNEVADGYEIILYLDTSTAPYYYQRQVKTYGGASEYPSFVEVKQTLSFDKNWSVSSIRSEEIYNISMPGLGSLKCTTNLLETFTYHDSIEIEEVESYYGQYKDLAPADDIPAEDLKPMDYLQSAFGSYLVNGGNFDIQLNMNENAISGKISFNLANMRVLADFGGLAILYDGQMVYLNIGDTTYQATIAEFTALFGDDVIPSNTSNVGFDAEAIMKELDSAIITETDTKVYLDATLHILGLEIKLCFDLNKLESGYDLSKIDAEMAAGDLNISATLKAISNVSEPTFDLENAVSLDGLKFIIEDVLSFIKEGKVTINAAGLVDKVNIQANLNVLFTDSIQMDGVVVVLIDGVEYEIKLFLRNNIIYMEFLENKVKLNMSIFSETVDLNPSQSISLSQIVDAIFSFDYKSLITKLEVGNNGIDLEFNIFNKDIIVSFENLDNGFEVVTNYYGIKIAATNEEFSVAEIAEEEYMNLEFLQDYYGIIKLLAQAEAYELAVEFQASIKGYTLAASGVIYLDKQLNITADLKVEYQGQSYKVTAEMIDQIIYLHFYNINVSLGFNQIETKAIAVSDLTIELKEIDGKLAIGVNIPQIGEVTAIFTKTDTGIEASLTDINIGEIEFTNIVATIKPTSKKTVEYVEAEYITLPQIQETIEEIKNLVEMIKGGASFDISLLVGTTTVSGQIIADSFQNIKGNIVVNGIEIELIYLNQKLYISCMGMKISCDVSNTEELQQALEKILQIVELPSVSLDIEKLLNSLSISLGNGIVINVLGNEIKLSSGVVTTPYGTIEMKSSEETVAMPEGEYYNLENAFQYLDVILTLAQAEAYAINATVLYGNMKIEFAGVVNKNLDTQARLSIIVGDNTYIIELKVVNKIVYATFGEMNVMFDLNNISSLVETLSSLLEYYMINMPTIDIDSLLNSLQLLCRDNLLLVRTMLGDFTLISQEGGLSVQSDSIILNVSASPCVDMVVPSNKYYNLETLITPTLVGLLKNPGFNMNVSLMVEAFGVQVEIAGTLDFNLKKMELQGTLDVSIENTTYRLNLWLYDGMIYASLGNTTIQLTFAEIISLFNINIDLNTIFGGIVEENGITKVGIHAEDLGLCYLLISILVKDTIDINISNMEIAGIIIKDINVSLVPSDEKVITAPVKTEHVITAVEIGNIINIIKNVITNVETSNGFTINVDLNLFDVNVLGTILLTKEKELYATLEVFTDQTNKLSIFIGYKENNVYVSLNDFKVVFDTRDGGILFDTIKELLSDYVQFDNIGLNIDINQIIETFKLVVSACEINENSSFLSILLGVMSLRDINLNIGIDKDGIALDGSINENISFGANLAYGADTPTINNSEYLILSYVVRLFENLETGVSSTGELSIKAMGYDILLPYEMLFKLDLIELLKGENVFKAIELELTITSMNYDPIVLSIVDGFIYLNSMGTKFKYEIPLYSLKGVLDSLFNSNATSEEESLTASTSNVVGIVNQIISYINGVVLVNSSTKLSISLSTALLNEINKMLYSLIGLEIALTDICLAVTLGPKTADFKVSAGLSAMGMDVNASITTNTTAADYSSTLTEADKAEFTLTTDFTEHPFVTRLLDIVQMLRGIVSMDYGVSGQGFNLNIPLEIDSGLVSSVTVNGSVGVFIDVPAIIAGADIFESFKLNANINIKAKMPWYLLGVVVNIDIEVFYIGDGYLYLIVDGNAAGIGFDIAENLIDLKGMIQTMTDSSSEQLTQIFLNDLLNQTINGFTTQTSGNKTSLTLSPTATKVVHKIWRQLVDLINTQVAAVGNSTLTSLIDGIVNLNMDVNSFVLEYLCNDDQSFKELKVTLAGYRHGTYTPTSLPITITSSGALASDHFDSYIAKANNYTSVRQEIASAKEAVADLGEFRYAEEYYEQAKVVQQQLDSMSNIAKASYTNTTVTEGINCYLELVDSQSKMTLILDYYKANDLASTVAMYSNDIIACLNGYEYFLENHIVFTAEELDIYLAIYNAVAEEQLSDFARKVNEFVQEEELDFVNSLESTINYKNQLNDLYNLYLGLSGSYQNAFKQFYPVEYGKLILMVESYNEVCIPYINEVIYEYIGSAMTLNEAMDEYLRVDFDVLKTYSLDANINDIVWSRLISFIYNQYLYEFDKKANAVTMNQAQAEYVYAIPELQGEYALLIPQFQGLVTVDMQELADMYTPSTVQYVSDVNAMVSTFSLSQEYVNYGFANAQKEYFYNYAKLEFTDDTYQSGLLISQYFSYSSETNIMSWFGGGTDAFTKFKIIALCMNFIKLLLNEGSTVSECQAAFVFLEDISVNYYYTKGVKGIWGSKSWYNIAHSYSEIFTNASSGYAYTAYQAYLNKVN